jgi:hypothetical protein
MSNLRAAAQQALEALEKLVIGTNYEEAVATEKTITDLRAALEQPEQTQDSTCNNTLRAQGKAYPRTCKKCGFGPCIADRVQPEQEQGPELRELLIAAAAMAVAADRKGAYQGASWVADAVLAQQGKEKPRSATSHIGTYYGRKNPALEQPEQSTKCGEPVETIVLLKDLPVGKLIDTPPPRREWRGLTEDEIYPLYSEPNSDAEMVEYARAAIEAALKERNA